MTLFGIADYLLYCVIFAVLPPSGAVPQAMVPEAAIHIQCPSL